MRCPVCSRYVNACTCDADDWRRVVGSSFNAAAHWAAVDLARQESTDTGDELARERSAVKSPLPLTKDQETET